MKKIRVFTILIILFIATGSCSKKNSGIVLGGDPPTWKMLTPMPTARHHFGFVEVDGLFYAIGGYNATGLNTVEVYNPANDSWQSKAVMPTARGYLVVATVAGKIYTIGGLTGGDLNNITYTNVTEEYDPATNQWTEKSPFPISRAFNTVVGNQFITGTALDGKIYVAAAGSILNNDQPMFIYDPVADTWQTDSSKSIAKFNLTPYFSAAIGTDMYVSEEYNFLKYTSTAGNWSVLQPFITARLGSCLASDVSNIYYLGGVTEGSSVNMTNDVEVYSVSVSSWSKLASMNVKRHSAAALTNNGNLYVVGGAEMQPDYQDVPLSSMEILQLKLRM